MFDGKDTASARSKCGLEKTSAYHQTRYCAGLAEANEDGDELWAVLLRCWNVVPAEGPGGNRGGASRCILA